MSRKFGGAWSAEQGNGWIRVWDHRVEVVAGDTALSLRLTGPEDRQEFLQSAIDSHLIRFATGQQLDISWTCA